MAKRFTREMLILQSFFFLTNVQDSKSCRLVNDVNMLTVVNNKKVLEFVLLFMNDVSVVKTFFA